MARTFANGVSDSIGKLSPANPGEIGTIWFRFKPNWSSTDLGVQHTLFEFYNAITDIFHYVRYVNNLVYVGREPGGRIDGVPDTGLFVAGVWATHQYSWDGSSGAEYFVDNVSKGTRSGTFTVGGYSSMAIGCGIGANHTVAADGDIAEWARWNRVLTAAERTVLQLTGCPLFVPSGLVRYYSIIGRNSPETDIVGGENLPVTGTPAAASHPRIFLPFSDQSYHVGDAETPNYTLTGRWRVF